MPRSAYIFYFVANLAPRAMMFVLLLILTRLMPMDQYGLFVLVVSTGELFDMSLGGWVRIFTLRSEGAVGALRPRRFGRILVLTGVMTTVSLALAAAIAIPQHERALPFVLSVMAYLLAFAPLRLALILLQIRRMHLAYAAVETLRAGGTLLATSAATVVLGAGFVHVSLGLAGATALAAFIGLFQALRGVPRPKLARTGYGAAFAFGLPIIGSGVLSYSIGLTDRYVVDLLIGPHAVAILAAAYSFARQPIDLFLGPLNTYAFPHLVRLYENEGAVVTGEAQAGLLTTSTMVGGAIAVGLMLLAEPLLTIFLPPDYRREGASIVPWLAAGAFFLIAKVFIFDNVFHLSKLTWIQPLVMLGPALLGLVLCIVLIPRVGILGAGISYAAAGGSSCLVSAFVTARIVPMRMPWASLAKIAVAMFCASLALLGARGPLAPHGAFAELAGSSLAFLVVYPALLGVLGISIRRAIETPWSPTRPGGLVGGGIAATLGKS